MACMQMLIIFHGAFRLQISVLTLVDAAFELFNNLQGQGGEWCTGVLFVQNSLSRNLIKW